MSLRKRPTTWTAHWPSIFSSKPKRNIRIFEPQTLGSSDSFQNVRFAIFLACTAEQTTSQVRISRAPLAEQNMWKGAKSVHFHWTLFSKFLRDSMKSDILWNTSQNCKTKGPFFCKTLSRPSLRGSLLRASHSAERSTFCRYPPTSWLLPLGRLVRNARKKRLNAERVRKRKSPSKESKRPKIGKKNDTSSTNLLLDVYFFPVKCSRQKTRTASWPSRAGRELTMVRRKPAPLPDPHCRTQTF